MCSNKWIRYIPYPEKVRKILPKTEEINVPVPNFFFNTASIECTGREHFFYGAFHWKLKIGIVS